MGGSTSHKRRFRRGCNNHHRRATSNNDASGTARVLDFSERAITNGRGYDLLTRAGWNEGQPLGASPGRSGTTSIVPIPIVIRPGRAGLGSSPVSPTSGTVPMWCKPIPQPNSDTENVVFDPLRPRCRFNSSHVVASLKALQKHEATCTYNPLNRRGVAASAHAAGSNAWLTGLGLSSDDETEVEDEDFSDMSDSDSSTESEIETDN